MRPQCNNISKITCTGPWVSAVAMSILRKDCKCGRSFNWCRCYMEDPWLNKAIIESVINQDWPCWLLLWQSLAHACTSGCMESPRSFQIIKASNSSKWLTSLRRNESHSLNSDDPATWAVPTKSENCDVCHWIRYVDSDGMFCVWCPWSQTKPFHASSKIWMRTGLKCSVESTFSQHKASVPCLLLSKTAVVASNIA